MTREELKEHCKRQIQQFERVKKLMPVTPNDWKRYEEHKLVLNLLEQEPTTRNCFGCKHSKDNHNAGTEECHLCMWENQYTPTTKNDLGVDCISREQAKAAIREKFKDLPSRVEINAILNDLPSVTPQECKVGKWIFVEGIRGKDNVEKCSCCGSHWKEAIIYRTDTQEYLRTRLLYCPNCGSRNEVEE